jgi:hypothetical protein
MRTVAYGKSLLKKVEHGMRKKRARPAKIGVKPVFFIHIPKTAGTSFRIAAIRYYGQGRVCSDYGKNSDNSSASVKNLTFPGADLHGLKRTLAVQEVGMITGHVNLSKYNPIIPLTDIATFLRNPIEQVISHYEHWVRLYGYSGTLEEFVREDRFANVQSRCLSGVPVSLIGFVGLADAYDPSVDIFNHTYGVQFETLFMNTKTTSGGSAPIYGSIEEVDPAMVALIRRRNRLDIDCYSKAQQLFKQRQDLIASDQPITYGIVRVQDGTKVSGIAFRRDCDRPVSLDFLINDEKVGETRACEFRPNMQTWSSPRSGCVGFRYTLEKPLGEGDQFSCKVGETGQELLHE